MFPMHATKEKPPMFPLFKRAKVDLVSKNWADRKQGTHQNQELPAAGMVSTLQSCMIVNVVHFARPPSMLIRKFNAKKVAKTRIELVTIR
jgi:hypothetical protein